jgi:enamine deaminase RidA (YjgF/YER057c/UK114 family)
MKNLKIIALLASCALLSLNLSYAASKVKASQMIDQLKIPLAKETSAAAGSYVSVVKSGKTLYVSGHISRKDGKVWEGKLGKNMTLEQGKLAARGIAIDLISTLNNFTKNIDSVKIVKLTVFVNSALNFREQHLVANGASDLLVEIFGENGKHARSAIGVTALPLNAAVEVEMIAEIK